MGVCTAYNQKIRPDSLPINAFIVFHQDGSSPLCGIPLKEVKTKIIYFCLYSCREIYHPQTIRTLVKERCTILCGYDGDNSLWIARRIFFFLRYIISHHYNHLLLEWAERTILVVAAVPGQVAASRFRRNWLCRNYWYYWPWFWIKKAQTRGINGKVGKLVTNIPLAHAVTRVTGTYILFVTYKFCRLAVKNNAFLRCALSICPPV